MFEAISLENLKSCDAFRYFEAFLLAFKNSFFVKDSPKPQNEQKTPSDVKLQLYNLKLKVNFIKIYTLYPE